MIEIIVLIFLSREIGKLAKAKGLPALQWKLTLVGAWILAEIIGFAIALLFFDKNNIVSLAIVAYGFAFTSYHIIKSYLQKLPDRDI